MLKKILDFITKPKTGLIIGVAGLVSGIIVLFTLPVPVGDYRYIFGQIGIGLMMVIMSIIEMYADKMKVVKE